MFDKKQIYEQVEYTLSDICQASGDLSLVSAWINSPFSTPYINYDKPILYDSFQKALYARHGGKISRQIIDLVEQKYKNDEEVEIQDD